MTGSLQIKNDIFYVVLNLKDENGKRKQKWVNTNLSVRGNKKNAERFMRDTISDYENQHITVDSKTLFTDYIKSWLESHKNQVDIITWQGYNSTVEKHIIPYFKKLKLDLKDVTPKHIQKYYNDKFTSGRCDGKGGLSARSVKLHSIVINMVLKDAAKKNIIAYNPASRAKVPTQEKIFKGHFYSVEQANKLLEVCNGELVQPIYYLTLNYGLRRSEVMGLKWDAIDFDNNMLSIKHTVVQNDTIVRKDKTKNHASKRSYPLMDDIKEILLGLKSEQDKSRELFGSEYIESDYVFTKPDGTLIRPDYVSQKLRKILKQHNLPYIRFHDIRHTCASILLSKGWTLKDIQEWLGHSDITITANIYTHIDITRKQELAKNMSNTFTLEKPQENRCSEKC